MDLVFRDEFEGPLNTKVWTTCHFWSPDDSCQNVTTNEQMCYLPEGVYTENGALVLRAQKKTASCDGYTLPYTSGMVQSGGNKYGKPAGFSFTYGYMEAFVKVPAGRGLWSGFWSPPQNFQWPPEIDAVEILGHEPWKAHFHYHWDEGGVHKQVGRSFSGPDFAQGYHVFGLLWEPGLLVWYVDGVERFRYENAATVANEPMYLDLNLSVGGEGSWPGPPDASTDSPAHYYVDYVRVWKRG